MQRVYIGLGANLGEPLQQLQQALELIAAIPGSKLIQQSPWYRSVAIGPAGQADYINGVAAIDTALEPLALLDQLQNIENKLGRVRRERWGARTLDLDILLFGELEIDIPRLQIPHPEMHNRNFVLQPLADIYSPPLLPKGDNLAELIAKLGSEGLRQLSDSGVD